MHPCNYCNDSPFLPPMRPLSPPLKCVYVCVRVCCGIHAPHGRQRNAIVFVLQTATTRVTNIVTSTVVVLMTARVDSANDIHPLFASVSFFPFFYWMSFQSSTLYTVHCTHYTLHNTALNCYIFSLQMYQ